MLQKARNLLNKSSRLRSQQFVNLDGNSMNLDHLNLLGHFQSQINITSSVQEQIQKTRRIVTRLIQNNTNEAYYGVNTGFGKFSKIKIPKDKLVQLQNNLILSHSTGVGNILSLNATRRMTALRINSLCKSGSGISYETVKGLIDFFNSGCVAWVPEQGTVGASGDLIPLAHLGLSLIGQGQCWNPKTQKFENSEKVLKMNNLSPVQLQSKDGLSLINGTQFITAVGSEGIQLAIELMKCVSPISALTLLALKGHSSNFDPRVSNLRPHIGQKVIAEKMSEFLPVGEFEENQDDVQDPYSLRCIPQIHGPVLDCLLQAIDLMEIEINSATDNPLVFDSPPHVVSQGNFHGEYPAKMLDTLAIYIHELGSVSYRRMKRMLNPDKSCGLPGFLSGDPGLGSGVMTWENLAAALNSENKTLCFPSSADSEETCADKEDQVSMGGFSARKFVQITKNVSQIIAIELFCAVKAIQIRKQENPNFIIPHQGLRRVYDFINKTSPILQHDRYLLPEYTLIYNFVVNGDMQEMILNLNSDSRKQYNFINDQLFLLTPRLDQNQNLIFTQTRAGQLQQGQLQNLFIKDTNIDQSKLRQIILKRQKEVKNNIICILDASMDDFGARANFGRGHTNKESAYDQFIKKYSNFMINKYNKDILNNLLLLGSLDLRDLQQQCKNKNANNLQDRQILINSVKETHQRSQRILKCVLQTGSCLFYMNGDHNNMYSIIKSCYNSFKVKPIVIYLDHHSDMRSSDDGPHSGTWLSQAYEEHLCQQTYIIGLNLTKNNQTSIENLDKHNIMYKPFLWEEIQSSTNCNPLLQIGSSIVEDIKKNSFDHLPVIFSICSDSICGMPSSAQNEVIGYNIMQIYPLISYLVNSLDVRCFNIAELKPSLDLSKNQSSGEFLSHSLYLFARTLYNKKKQLNQIIKL